MKKSGLLFILHSLQSYCFIIQMDSNSSSLCKAVWLAVVRLILTSSLVELSVLVSVFNSSESLERWFELVGHSSSSSVIVNGRTDATERLRGRSAEGSLQVKITLFVYECVCLHLQGWLHLKSRDMKEWDWLLSVLLHKHNNENVHINTWMFLWKSVMQSVTVCS